MMFEFFLAAALQATAPAEPMVTVRQRNSIDVPDEIAPAILPYLMCILEGVNASAPLSSAEDVRTAQEQAAKICSPVRDKAKADALKMLSNSDIPAGNRAAFVEAALTRLLHVHDGLATQLHAANTNSKPRNQ